MGFFVRDVYLTYVYFLCSICIFVSRYSKRIKEVTMVIRRNLSSREEQNLNRLGLSSAVKDAVRGVWETEVEPKFNKTFEVIYAIVAVLIVLLGAGSVFLHNPLAERLDALFMFCVWAGYIVSMPILKFCSMIGFICVIRTGRVDPLGRIAMSFLMKQHPLKITGMLAVLLSLIGMLSMSGHVTTAVFVFIAFAVAKMIAMSMTTPVKTAIRKIEVEAIQ